MSLDLSRPILCLITTGASHASNYPAESQRILKVANEAISAGVDLIQLREKKLTGKLLFELAQRVAEVTRGSRTKLLVNDRLDIALAAGADGVHLPSDSVPAVVVRAHAQADLIIGVSCHSADEVAAAAESGATFALYGPVFASPGKGDGNGLANLRDVCQTAKGFPLLAVGGIDGTNYNSVIDAGAAGFAAIRALNDIDSMRRIARVIGR